MSSPKISVGLVAASCAVVFAVTGCQPATDTVAANKPLVGSGSVSSHHHHAVVRKHAHAHRPTHATARGDVLVDGGRIVLPNRHRTPGAVNAAVTQQTIRSTICRTGYTSTIRPSSSYTTSLKVQQLDSGYAFRGDRSTHDYEEDHLIALELGGAPNNVRNLWPEPYASSAGARTKDLVENQLHDLVCAGRISLRAAQHAIATNWWQAYQLYGGRGVPDVYFGAYVGSRSTTSTSAGTSTSTSGGATARCVDGTLSYSAHRSGTCSHHGGVAQWINPPTS
jgi:hypothetical protein